LPAGITRLSFGQGDINFSRVHVGDKIWKTSDPELERRLRRSFDGDTPKFQRPLSLEIHGFVVARILALDLRWTWSHEADALWERVDARLWRRTRNPWSVLQSASARRLQRLAADAAFRKQLAGFMAARQEYLERPGWFVANYGRAALTRVAYLSMEFGLGAALPLLLIGMMSREALVRWRDRMLSAGQGGKAVMGVLLLSLGVLILTGLDKRAEAALVDASPAWLTELTTRF